MAKTEHFEIDKPTPENEISEEVFVLQAAFDQIDAILHGIAETLANKSDSAHGHTMAQIAGLVGALAGKMSADKTFALGELSDVIGAGAAGNNYLLSKTPAGFAFQSAAALLGLHQHPMADIIGLDDELNSRFAALVAAAPEALDTLNKLAAALGNDPNFATTVATQIGQINARLSDPWVTSFPVGIPFPLDPSASAPPTDNENYRYIVLSAGQTGSGGYNEGVLTDETVSGAWPFIFAGATVSLAGSPMDTQTIPLINTERTFIRPGDAGDLQSDALQNITGQFTIRRRETDTAIHSVEGAFSEEAGAASISFGNGASGRAQHRLIFDASLVARTADETRPRNRGYNFYMRIK